MHINTQTSMHANTHPNKQTHGQKQTSTHPFNGPWSTNVWPEFEFICKYSGFDVPNLLTVKLNNFLLYKIRLILSSRRTGRGEEGMLEDYVCLPVLYESVQIDDLRPSLSLAQFYMPYLP